MALFAGDEALAMGRHDAAIARFEDVSTVEQEQEQRHPTVAHACAGLFLNDGVIIDGSILRECL